MRTRRAVVTIAALAASGCTALVGLDDHHADMSDASGVDGAADATSDATSDAGSDAGPDALPDGGLLDGGGSSFCAVDGGWRFCESFDLGPFPPSNWMPPEFFSPSMIGYATNDSFSPPQALSATTGFATPTGNSHAYLYRTTDINGTIAEVDLVFQLKLGVIGGVDGGAGGQSDLVHLVFNNGAYVFTFGVGTTANAYVLEKQRDAGTTTDSQTTNLAATIPVSWRRVDVHLVFKPIPQFTIAIEGVGAGGARPFKLPPSLGTTLTLEIGLPYSEGKWTVLVDDVALRVVL